MEIQNKYMVVRNREGWSESYGDRRRHESEEKRK